MCLDQWDMLGIALDTSACGMLNGITDKEKGTDKTMQTMTLEWVAEQVCGECGLGVFVRHGEFVLCTDCGHFHPMDPVNLGEGERFEWHFTTQARGEQTLHVASYFIS